MNECERRERSGMNINSFGVGSVAEDCNAKIDLRLLSLDRPSILFDLYSTIKTIAESYNNGQNEYVLWVYMHVLWISHKMISH